ncbi:hypothetical protein [Helicobacter equorum]|uniref:Uncharacterized protein n=1 Tax=Helicobacter equorum TaxID=361872 RepID=A0A3D8IPZ0_9HELI|nr:hypothetical protein [Helicobacter equorum]RDU67262.1 hypothetical protein CQA54_04580 [Helicobacter equorum]
MDSSMDKQTQIQIACILSDIFLESALIYKDDGTGFDKGDIVANKKGVEYGNELRIRYGKII